MSSVTFCTFCYSGDYNLLHSPGQLKKQIDSNQYDFDDIIVVHQKCRIEPFEIVCKEVLIEDDSHIDKILKAYKYDLSKPQYESPDNNHQWKYHNVNHLYGISFSSTEYTLFADNDCWMVPPSDWVSYAINVLENNPRIFIVSPNDGEETRYTNRMSQQMFLCRTKEFREADFNQPGFTGNVKDYDTMPEYHAMLEGRMDYHCQQSEQFRFVCPSKYRYWHHNRFNEQGHFEVDYSKY